MIKVHIFHLISYIFIMLVSFTIVSSGVRRIYFSRGRIFFRGGRIKIWGCRLEPKGREKIFCPPCFFSAPSAEFNSAPGAEQTRGGAENLIIPRERGRNI